MDKLEFGRYIATPLRSILTRMSERDKLCAHLRILGIQAQISERGRPEEKIAPWGKSLGIIDTQDALIHWVNISKDNDPDNKALWYIEYGVPDSRITAGFPKVAIRTKRIKRVPILGKVIDLKWKGKDFGLGLIEGLSHDVSLKEQIMVAHDLDIDAYPEHSCWILTVEDVRAPTKLAWDCYRSIASHLLRTPLPSDI